MAVSPGSAITQHFATLTDPRVERTNEHRLRDILTLALCAIISGADEWVAMEEYGNAKREGFDTLLPLPNGIPSHDTFGRVFAALDPDQFQPCFLAWVQSAVTQTDGAVIACDGKRVRRSHDRGAGKSAVHIVSAWASANRLVLGQVAVDEKSNEITAIPALLSLLMRKGCIVTIDAMGCQTAIARTIVEKGADYVRARTENQDSLHHEVVHLFADAEETGGADSITDDAQTIEGGHARGEIRRDRMISDPVTIAHVDPEGAWAGLRSIGMVAAERREKGGAGKVTRETR